MLWDKGRIVALGWGPEEQLTVVNDLGQVSKAVGGAFMGCFPGRSFLCELGQMAGSEC